MARRPRKYTPYALAKSAERWDAFGGSDPSGFRELDRILRKEEGARPTGREITADEVLGRRKGKR